MSKKMNNQFACSRMMLPEHREQLNRHRRALEEHERQKPPVLDDRQQDELSQLLLMSVQSKTAVRLTWHNGCTTESTEGIVCRIDMQARQVVVNTGAGRRRVALDRIVEAAQD